MEKTSKGSGLTADQMIKLAELTSGVKFPAGLEEQAKSAFEFRRLLLSESDRGCALMAAAHLDDRLKSRLQGCLALNSDMRRRMFDFNGPLGTFSSRITMAYAIGKLPRTFLNDLTHIRNIRNRFAHEATEMSFETPEVLGTVRKLSFHPHDTDEEPRKIFVTVTMGLMGFLSDAKNLTPFKPLPDPDLEELQRNHDTHLKRVNVLLAGIETLHSTRTSGEQTNVQGSQDGNGRVPPVEDH